MGTETKAHLGMLGADRAGEYYLFPGSKDSREETPVQVAVRTFQGLWGQVVRESILRTTRVAKVPPGSRRAGGHVTPRNV